MCKDQVGMEEFSTKNFPYEERQAGCGTYTRGMATPGPPPGLQVRR